MVFKDLIIFPNTLAFGASGGRSWSTDVVRTGGGQAITNQNYPVPLGRWRVSLENRTPVQINAARGLVDAVRGQAFAFRFQAPGDYRVSRTAARRLTSTTFQMRSVTRAGGDPFFIDVKKPKKNDANLIVALGNTPTTNFTMDTTTGIITTSAAQPTSVIVYVTGDYHIPVMLGTDMADFAWDDPGLASWGGIELYEVPII